MLIRAATPADIPAMMSLAARSATAAQWTAAQYELAFSNSHPRRLVLAAEEDTSVLAFLIAQAAAGEWELENIAVAGPARRRGLGSRLLGEFLDRIKAQGAHAVFLEVRESNRPARSLYEKWAFEECGRRSDYYRDPVEDALLYRLALS
ncbi:MAG TPA: ribosomal protein S18-alanine N-acetyltransferase [Terriglobales bacterium]